jgi:2-keto-4-pentenoate hydratase/2-oxohepta-3-ene-1,7-dioic acid hydratase in catechol pathway
MKLLRYQHESEVRVGILDNEHVVDLVDALASGGTLSEGDRRIIADTTALIAAGEHGRELSERALELSQSKGVGRNPLARLRLRAPLRPEIILCSGENYWDHREEKPPVEGKEPEFFIKVPHGVIGSDEDIVLDGAVTRKLDYETELAVVIGQPGRHISVEKALQHVFGYTVMNDVTARDRQVRMRPDGTCWYALGPGKNFDTCAPMGPVLVTRDEIPDPQTLELRTRINDTVRQMNSTAKMIWSVAELVKFFSTFLTLQPGFVISTGTPGGTAWASDPDLGGRPYQRGDVVRPAGYLAPGDMVSCEIERIGVLRNKVVRPS